jgi:uncharacterized membrane protein YeaQ/YmgE (transglycosylase-associated protein family)
MGFVTTVVLGIIGVRRRFLGYVLFHKHISQGALQPAGIVGSVISESVAGNGSSRKAGSKA